MNLERMATITGKAVGSTGLVVALVSLFRLDGTGVGVGLMLALYGLALLLVAAVYGELRAIREYLSYMAAKAARGVVDPGDR
ncbi:hypothetical protein [Thermus sp. NEB1569]|uniref:hypothetical protein n=1 Tax=Thermus sp. NEB1569 TaxID=2918899 RepID=UPI001EFBC868|nr:hypothetical protein [Thermus sp. NEB1569]ULR39737.1 hypothetical protein MI302_00245 [Thermus sp. NEB1569]